MEMEKVPQEGFRIIGLDIAGFNRSSVLKNLLLPYKLLKSAWQARKIIADFTPDVVVGVGGYASFPILNAAQGLRIPTLLQEQNSFAGKSNKILGRKASAICVAYEDMDRFFPKERIVVTGNPVRKVISGSVLSRDEGQDLLGLDRTKKTILVIGGSLGAKSVNEAIDAGLETLVQDDVQVLWQTGKPYYEKAIQRAKAFEEQVKVFDFIRQMELAYAAADMVISRAGALAIAELCIVAKPVIFVPYPHAAEDHQTNNAMALVVHGAAQMVKDVDAATDLVPKLQHLLRDHAAQEIMCTALKKMAIRDADERIARELLRLRPS
jgi:UDP-N-acetylglucosamine--N-acetylmuramyl-(pentapeptide) pyrophosphoryl-undecaprenol N-acetylglucosamine transferase